MLTSVAKEVAAAIVGGERGEERFQEELWLGSDFFQVCRDGKKRKEKWGHFSAFSLLPRGNWPGC
jgi:hypothetical protein